MPVIVRVDIVGRDILPVQRPGSNLGIYRIAPAEHRKVIRLPYLTVDILKARAVFLRHEQQYHRGLGLVQKYLPDKAVVGILVRIESFLPMRICHS